MYVFLSLRTVLYLFFRILEENSFLIEFIVSRKVVFMYLGEVSIDVPNLSSGRGGIFLGDNVSNGGLTRCKMHCS